MIEVLIFNQQDKIKPNMKLLKSVAKKTLKMEKRNDAELSIAIVDDKYIRELNRKFRNIDEVTDVLSFPLEEEEIREDAVISVETGMKKVACPLLGDVVISVETALKQAKSVNYSLNFEMANLLIHGILHLLGYDHKVSDEKSDMRKREKEILKECETIIEGKKNN